MKYGKTPDLKLAEHVERRFWLDVDSDVTIEDVEKPEFWRGLSRKMPPKTLVTVSSKDGSWECTYRVMRSDPNFAILRRISPPLGLAAQDTPTDKESSTVKEPSPAYAVKWTGPHSKFRIMRTGDKSVVKDEFETKEEAEEYLKQYIETLTASI